MEVYESRVKAHRAVFDHFDGCDHPDHCDRAEPFLTDSEANEQSDVDCKMVTRCRNCTVYCRVFYNNGETHE